VCGGKRSENAMSEVGGKWDATCEASRQSSVFMLTMELWSSLIADVAPIFTVEMVEFFFSVSFQIY
jgi:hypothetical protein